MSKQVKNQIQRSTKTYKNILNHMIAAAQIEIGLISDDLMFSPNKALSSTASDLIIQAASLESLINVYDEMNEAE